MVSGSEFRWGYPSSEYFGKENTKPSVHLMIALTTVFLIPIFINSTMKYMKRNNVFHTYRRLKFYNSYMKFIQILDHRLLYTPVSILDCFIGFMWILINVIFVDPFDFPRQIGYLVVCNTALIMLPIFRNSIFSALLAIPFERGIKYHRWLGRGLFFLITIHMVGYWDKWIRARNFKDQFLVLPNLFAHLAWLASFILTISSLNVIRRNWFEVFFYTHFAFIFYFIFGILHFPALLPYALPGFILYAVDRIIRVIRARPPNDDVTIVSDGSITRIKGKRIGILNYECGQYCFINIPEISKLQWHPVSLCSAPSDVSFMFYVKTLGGWSRQLAKLNGRSPEVKIDGPYGALTHDIESYDVIILCCGGIGVTPMISILRDLYYKIMTRLTDVKKVYLFWTMRDPAMYYTMGDCLDELLTGQASNCFNLSVWITRPGVSSPLFIRGKPDWKEIFLTVRDTHSDVDRIAVLSCGPPALVNTTWDCCNQLSTETTSFDFHQETFEF